MNSKNNSAKKSGSKKGSAAKDNLEIIDEPVIQNSASKKRSASKGEEVIVENQTPRKSVGKGSKAKEEVIEVVQEQQINKKSTSKKGSVTKEEIEIVEKEIVKINTPKKSAQKQEVNVIIEEQVKKASASSKGSKLKEEVVPTLIKQGTPNKSAGKASKSKESQLEEEVPQNPKKSASNKGSKTKDAVVEEVSPFKALYNKKAQNQKAQQIEEEEEDDDEEDLNDELPEGEEGEGVDDFGDDEELPEGVEGILAEDELEGEGDEFDGEGEEFDEEDMDELGERPPGFIGHGVVPDPEDEFAFDANKKPKIMGMTPGNIEVDLALVRMKIEDILKTLASFKDLKDPVRDRKSYLEEFKENLCTYYGYNSELIEIFLNTFSPGECVQFLEANESHRPSTIRTNTLKTNRKHLAQILMQRGVSLEPLAEWSKVGIKIFETKVPIGATPEYLAGHYMLQSASSFLPVMALAPQMGERVLDMAAAPGGKTTYIAQLMKNTGILLANDAKLERLKSLKFNLQRMGVTNCMVCNYDGRKLPGVMKGFDRVLLDAPCTGLGIIAKDHSIKSSRMFIDVKKMSHLQKELLTAAIDCTKPGGYVVYSTCSVTVEENEWVVDYALKNRYVKLVETGVEVGEEGYVKYMEKRFDPSLKLTKRILPHIHNMDGFYFAKLKKLKNGNRKDEPEVQEAMKAKKSKVNEKADKKQKNKNTKEPKTVEEEEAELEEENEDEEAFEDQPEDNEEEEEILPAKPQKQQQKPQQQKQQQQQQRQNKNQGPADKNGNQNKNKRNASLDLEGELEKEEKEEKHASASLNSLKGKNKGQGNKQQGFQKGGKKKVK